jgi:hypothetical protein
LGDEDGIATRGDLMDSHTPYSRVGGEGNDRISGSVAAVEGTWLASGIGEHLAQESLA